MASVEILPCFGRDDSTLIQKMIDDAKAAGENTITIPKINPETGATGYVIGSTIWLSSDTTVILDGCTMRFADDVMCNMFASMGAWDETFGESELAEQRNIKIIGKNGATFDGGNSNGKTEKTVLPGERMVWNCFVLFRNLDGFEISGIKAVSARYWCFTFMYAKNGSIHDIEFDCRNEKPNQDGIDLRGGCNNIDIYNLAGVTGDDTVALTTIGTSNAWWMIKGMSDVDIHDVKMYNIDAGCSGGHGIIRLLAHDGRKVYNVDIKNIRDASLDGLGKSCSAVIRVGDKNYSSVSQQSYGDISGITVDGVISNSRAAVYIKHSAITSKHITCENITAVEGEGLKLDYPDSFCE